MYTQCPDCSTAFRVTADVLKQAAGKVRCGGCGNAFNALAYLSESMPEQSAPREDKEALPELTPEPNQKSEGLPASISAEQSAALLKTLDELAGSDIRIEDTGVEWRVLDEEEVGEAADDPIADEAAANDVQDESFEPDEFVVRESDVDEFLEESPTPVDQFLTETPAQIDSPEIFKEADDEPARTSVDELRFDDNTPLPDDFDLDDESLFPPAQIDELEENTDEPADIEDDEPQADFDLSEPDEWTDILGEFEDLVEAVAEPVEDELEADIEAELEAIETADEVAPETTEDSGNELLDMDSQFALQAEAMGIDLSGMHESLEEPVIEEDIDLELLLEDADVEDQDIENLLDEDLVDEVADNDEDAQLDFVEEDEIDEPEEDEPELDELEEVEPEEDEPELDELEEVEPEEDEPEDDEPEEVEPEEDEPEEDEPEVVESEVDELEEGEPEVDEPEVDELEEDEPEIDQSEDEGDEFELPPLTEEEQTINMQIDQDLLALAVEDEDGFASTIVIPEEATEEKALKDKKKDKKKKKKDKGKDKDKEETLKDTSAGFETIIMEGEAFRSSDNSDNHAAAAASLASAAAEREATRTTNTGGKRWGMIGGAVALVLILTAQVLHQSREALATIPAFNSIAGPLYRSIGMPLSPEWDITGWRFEATKGSTDENDENLTVYSRLGNKSDKPLPYPIVAISLTDRFEETVGSRILDPAEYLSSDLDPRKLVEPGNTFNAAITIQSPAEEATGFKLNVCYRESGGDLRCAIDDFK